MTSTQRTRTTPLTTRLMALVLVCAFVLQSAAQAGQGCLARVFTGACCCSAVATDATPAHACCVQAAEAAPHNSSGAPRVDDQRGCSCATALQPTAPAAPGAPDVALERSLERILYAQPIAPVAYLALAVIAQVEQRALERPPGPAIPSLASFATTRLAQRGVSGLLSELCTLHR